MTRTPSFADDPARYQPTRCACCRHCWLKRSTGRCVHDGPFDGWRRPDGTVATLDDIEAGR